MSPSWSRLRQSAALGHSLSSSAWSLSPGSAVSPPSSSFFPSLPVQSPNWGTHLPGYHISGEGTGPWETQARAVSRSWFSREPWQRGLGRKAQQGGELGSRTGNWKGKGVGGLGSSLPPTLPLLPIPSPAATHSRQGLGAVSGRGVGVGEQERLCVSGSEGG